MPAPLPQVPTSGADFQTKNGGFLEYEVEIFGTSRYGSSLDPTARLPPPPNPPHQWQLPLPRHEVVASEEGVSSEGTVHVSAQHEDDARGEGEQSLPHVTRHTF